MLKLCRINLDQRDRLYADIDRYVQKLVRQLRPHLVLLFGSVASGDMNEGSDVDLLVVAGFTESFLDRIKTLLELNNLGLPLEPVGYTPGEFGQMREEGNPFILTVLETGRVLYQDPAFSLGGKP